MAFLELGDDAALEILQRSMDNLPADFTNNHLVDLAGAFLEAGYITEASNCVKWLEEQRVALLNQNKNPIQRIFLRGAYDKRVALLRGKLEEALSAAKSGDNNL